MSVAKESDRVENVLQVSCMFNCIPNIEAIIEEDEIKEDKLRDVRLMLDMVMMAHTNIRKGVYAIGQISS